MKSIIEKIILFSFLIVLLIPNVTFAESKTFIKEYTYQASEIDTIESCRIIALEQVKRLLLEEIGIYLEIHTEVKNSQLSLDKVTALTAGILQTKIIAENMRGNKYWLKAKIDVDPNSVVKSIDIFRNDIKKSQELEDVKKKAEAFLAETITLKRELSLAKANRTAIEYKYKRAIDGLDSISWYEKGNSLALSHNYKEAADAFLKALDSNTEDIKKFGSLIQTYYKDGTQEEAAIYARYFNKSYALAHTLYYCLGQMELRLGHYMSAANLFDAYIDDKYITVKYTSTAHILRSLAYWKLSDVSETELTDFATIAKENKLDKKMYKMYEGLKEDIPIFYQKAFYDASKAIEIDPMDAEAYCMRAILYFDKADYESAITDCKKALELKPQNADAYFVISLAYFQMGDFNKSKFYYSKAIENEPMITKGLEMLEKEKGYLFSYKQKNTFDKIKKILLNGL